MTTTTKTRTARLRCPRCKRFASKTGCKVCLTAAPALAPAPALRREVLAVRSAPAPLAPEACSAVALVTTVAPVRSPGVLSRAWWTARPGQLGMTPRWAALGTYLALVGIPLLGLLACR